MSNKAPVMDIDPEKWIQVFRGITNATNERTFVATSIPQSGVGNSAPVIDYESGIGYGQARAVASALVLANMNSLPLDWAARCSVGGVNMNFFIVKQLPVLPPEAYLERIPSIGYGVASMSRAQGVFGSPDVAGVRVSETSHGVDTSHINRPTYVEMIIPRVLELVYTSDDMKGFAEDIGYNGPPFKWDDSRRHDLQSELDAIYAHMYGLDRDEVEWILDAPAPSASFPALKNKEINQFDEYRTKRLVLSAYDQLASGQSLMLTREHRHYRLQHVVSNQDS